MTIHDVARRYLTWSLLALAGLVPRLFRRIAWGRTGVPPADPRIAVIAVVVPMRAVAMVVMVVDGLRNPDVVVPSLGLFLTLAMAVVVAPAAAIHRVPPRWVGPIGRLTLAADFALALGWLLLIVDGTAPIALMIFVLVSIEAALLFRWSGVLGFVIGFTALGWLPFWERRAMFGFDMRIAPFANEAVIVLITSIILGALTEESERRRETAVRAAELASRRAEMSRALNAIAQRLGKSLKPQETLDAVVECLGARDEGSWTAALRQGEGGLQISCQRGPEVVTAPSLSTQLTATANAGVTIHRRQDGAAAAIWQALPEPLQHYTMMAVAPIPVHDSVMATIVCLSSGDGGADGDDVAFLEGVSHHTSAALEKAVLYEEIEALSLTDALTRLLNRRAFDARLEEEVARAERYGSPLALAMLDVDFFKLLNDTQGHPAGDRVLRHLGELLLGVGVKRDADSAFRLGGEEFAILLPNTDGDAAQSMAERLRRTVAEELFPEAASQPKGHLTISIGVAAYPAHATTGTELIERADLALYAAKAAGRNCVRLHEGAAIPRTAAR